MALQGLLGLAKTVVIPTIFYAGMCCCQNSGFRRVLLWFLVVVTTVLNLVMMVWFFFGCYWVLQDYPGVVYDDPTSLMYCQPDTYKFALATVLIGLIGVGLCVFLLCCGCCLILFFQCV